MGTKWSFLVFVHLLVLKISFKNKHLFTFLEIILYFEPQELHGPFRSYQFSLSESFPDNARIDYQLCMLITKSLKNKYHFEYAYFILSLLGLSLRTSASAFWIVIISSLQPNFGILVWVLVLMNSMGFLFLSIYLYNFVLLWGVPSTIYHLHILLVYAP